MKCCVKVLWLHYDFQTNVSPLFCNCCRWIDSCGVLLEFKPLFPASFSCKRSLRSPLSSVIQRLLERESLDHVLTGGISLLGMGKFSCSLDQHAFWFPWLPGGMLLDGNWPFWAASESFSYLTYQEPRECKLKQALVGAHQLNRLMIPVRRCEIIYPLNTQAWQVSVFWVTNVMPTM